MAVLLQEITDNLAKLPLSTATDHYRDDQAKLAVTSSQGKEGVPEVVHGAIKDGYR